MSEIKEPANRYCGNCENKTKCNTEHKNSKCLIYCNRRLEGVYTIVSLEELNKK